MQPQAIIDPGAAVPDDGVCCLGCEYPLRGLGRDGRCPECGESIDASWRRHELQLAHGYVPLRLASPAWLRRMGWGCALLVASAGVTVGLNAFLMLTRWFGLVPLLISLTSVLAMITGIWLLGAAEPAAPERNPITRWVIRGGAIFVLLTLLFTLFDLWTGWSAGTGFWRTRAVIVGAVAAPVTFVAWRHLAMQARRANHAGLTRHARLLARLLPALIVVQAIFFQRFGVPPTNTWILKPDPVIGQVQSIALLPFSILQWPRVDAPLIFWCLVAVTSLAAVVTLARFSKVFFAAAAGRTGRT